MTDVDVRRCGVETGLNLKRSALFIRPFAFWEVCLADDLDRATLIISSCFRAIGNDARRREWQSI
jgi:hypothetical protein